jgi:hypothetical protein
MSRLARTLQTSDSPPPNHGLPRTSTGNWLLVQVWDGAVLARFDDEVGARAAMSRLDDDEIVVLHVRT